MNFHLEDKSNLNAKKFNNLLHSYGLQQLVQEPTHRNNHTLDVVITRLSENTVYDLDVVDHLISDHKTVSFSLHTQRPPLPKKTIVYRSISRINRSELMKDIQDDDCLNGNALQDVTDCEECVQMYNKAAASLLNKHAPEKKSW